VITLLADRHIPWLDELLPEGVRLLRYDPQRGFGSDARVADALFVRTVSDVNALTFSDAGFERLSFVASASAGVDHVDRGFLAGRGVEFASAAGCNAQAVAEFVATGVLDWHLEHGVELAGRRLGVVGGGNTGSAVARLLSRFGMQVVVHDPPRAQREAGFVSATEGGVASGRQQGDAPWTGYGIAEEGGVASGRQQGEAPRTGYFIAEEGGVGSGRQQGEAPRREAGFVSATIEEVLDVDVLTFHVPLVAKVDNPDGFPVTHNWLSADRLEACRAQLVVNAARGGVVDEGALGVVRRQRGLDFLGDVWFGEPGADCDSVLGAWLATPHIAGYSVQAKWNATAWIVRDFCRFFGIEVESGRKLSAATLYPEFDVNTALSIPDSSQRLRHILHQTHPMFRYSAILKQAASEGLSCLRETFVRLRTQEPLRNEYLHIGFPPELSKLHPELSALSSD
jgi:phosphoglycerate dehydrogenase-like enzyme